MADWVRRNFSGAGLTQVPPGPHLSTLQAHYGGTVLLLIDISGSMAGMPLVEAVRGARGFVGEAVEAHYKVGVFLWNTQVVAACQPTREAGDSERVLTRAVAGGGTTLLPALIRAHDVLGQFTGDRVVAIFGDGAVGPRDQVREEVARMKADDIRFVTRGLGAYAAHAFSELSDEEPEKSEVSDLSGLASGIQDMASTLKSKPTGLRG